MNLSQQDYVKRIEELNQALINAWEQDQRVKSLKIAIQVGAQYKTKRKKKKKKKKQTKEKMIIIMIRLKNSK